MALEAGILKKYTSITAMKNAPTAEKHQVWGPVSRTEPSIDLMKEPNMALQVTISAKHKAMKWEQVKNRLQV